MARANRPGKRERQRKAIAREAKARSLIITANMRENAETPKPVMLPAIDENGRLTSRLQKGPQGYERRAGHSSASRDHLKVGTGTVGFYGGRFYSPKDTVTKRENDGGKLVPLGAPRPTPGVNVSARFREDGFEVDTREAKRSVKIERKQGSGKMRVWRDCGIRLRDPTEKV